MIIPTTDEMIYNGIIGETNDYDGVTIDQLAEKLTPIYDAYYKSITKEEFYEIVEEIVFKLLKYAVLYMIHGQLYRHDNILHVGDIIPDVLRRHMYWKDNENYFYR